MRAARIGRRLCGWVVVLALLAPVGCVKQVRSGRGKKGELLGKFRLSMYWQVRERWHKGPRRTPLYQKGKRVAWVSESFARAVRLQGTGKLRNGWVVQYVATCRKKGRFCLRVRVLNARRYPLGRGASRKPLRPLRSLAADTRQFAFGTWLYIPALGRMLRQRGKKHNGCFVIHDRGGRIRGNRLDLFVGHRGLYRRYLKRGIPQKVRVYIDHPRCLRRRG